MAQGPALGDRHFTARDALEDSHPCLLQLVGFHVHQVGTGQAMLGDQDWLLVPLDIREQYEKQLKDLQEAYGEAMLELRARKKLTALMEREDGQ